MHDEAWSFLVVPEIPLTKSVKRCSDHEDCSALRYFNRLLLNLKGPAKILGTSVDVDTCRKAW